MGDTLLHIAARTNSAELVHYLVGQGARTNALNAAGFTPLVVAAAGGQLKTMRALLVAARPVVANANGASFANVHPDFDAALSAADGRQQIRAISLLMEWWHRHHAAQEHWFVKSLREKTAADGPAAMGGGGGGGGGALRAEGGGALGGSAKNRRTDSMRITSWRLTGQRRDSPRRRRGRGAARVARVVPARASRPPSGKSKRRA